MRVRMPATSRYLFPQAVEQSFPQVFPVYLRKLRIFREARDTNELFLEFPPRFSIGNHGKSSSLWFVLMYSEMLLVFPVLHR